MLQRTVFATVALAAVFAFAPVTHAQQAGYDGTWSTASSPAGGRGGGNLSMQATQRNGGVTLTYGGGTMVCSLSGRDCEGTWQGRSGSGWFRITFSADGSHFSGNWGYGTEYSVSGSFRGSR